MQPGDIYRMDFAFEPPGQGSEYRPALIMHVDFKTSLAYVIKVTTSSSNIDFPYRECIKHKDFASLDRISYAQYDWYNIISINVKCKYLGTLHFADFRRITKRFKNFHDL